MQILIWKKKISFSGSANRKMSREIFIWKILIFFPTTGNAEMILTYINVESAGLISWHEEKGSHNILPTFIYFSSQPNQWVKAKKQSLRIMNFV